MALDLLSINNGNTGSPAGDANRGIPRYLVVGSKEFVAANYASVTAFKAAYKAAALLPRSASGKLVVLPIITNVENATEANGEGTQNQGFKEILREGTPAFNLGVRVSNRQAQVLRNLNGKDSYVFVVDSNKNMWGRLTDAGVFKGEEAKIQVGGDNFTDGQSSKFVTVSLSYTNVTDFYDFSAYFPIDFNVNDYGSLKDVSIVEKAAASTNVFTVGGQIKTGRAGTTLDIYEDYSTALASASMWVATNVDTGVAITITSVTADAANEGWDITLDTTEFTALSAGTQISINLAAPSVLDAASVTGIEGVEIIYTK